MRPKCESERGGALVGYLPADLSLSLKLGDWIGNVVLEGRSPESRGD